MKNNKLIGRFRCTTGQVIWPIKMYRILSCLILNMLLGDIASLWRHMKGKFSPCIKVPHSRHRGEHDAQNAGHRSAQHQVLTCFTYQGRSPWYPFDLKAVWSLWPVTIWRKSAYKIHFVYIMIGWMLHEQNLVANRGFHSLKHGLDVIAK
jgi:hypothetical protein